MSNTKSFQRKIIYGGCMIALLVLISLISRPATSDPNNQGGWLAQKRHEYRITQADLGQIDPASEAMRLSLMGMDGVAITMLWNKLNRHQKMEQWALMESTARTISHLNPHLLKVWEHQAWNLSYNVSREFDDYRHRYLWVKKGINYHMEGTDYNYDEPRMKDSIGHFFGQKFGNADEKVQYRRLFPEDDLFHEQITEHLAGSDYTLENDAEGAIDGKPDHWKVGRIWNFWAQKNVDEGRGSIGNMSHTIFHSQPVKRLMSYAENIEKEGYIGDKARLAWEQSNNEWDEFGDRSLPSSYGIEIRLNDSVRMRQQYEELMERFNEIAEDELEQFKEEETAKLPEDVRVALDTPAEDRTEQQQALAERAESAMLFSLRRVVKLISDPARQIDAARVAREIDDLRFLIDVVERQRSIVAFDYWGTRSESESKEQAIRARQYLYDARQAMQSANLVEAQEKFEAAWDVWAEIYETYPSLKEDSASDDLIAAIKEYRGLLELQLGEDLPPDFPLMELLRIHDDEFQEPATAAVESTESETPMAETPEDATLEDGAKAESPMTEAPADAAPADPAAPAEAVSEDEPAAEATPTEEMKREETPPAAEEAATDESPAPMPEEPAAENSDAEKPAEQPEPMEDSPAEPEAEAEPAKSEPEAEGETESSEEPTAESSEEEEPVASEEEDAS
ncbi:MAG: hypothetical protein WDZ51_05760 [Pirellulaceae bacterium]